MGFRDRSYIRIFEFKDGTTGKSGTIRIAISKKNANGKYETEFSNNFVRVAGSAYEQMKAVEIPKKGLQARIAGCDVTGGLWNKEKEVQSPYWFVIYGLDFEGDEGFTSKKASGKSSAAKPKTQPAPAKEEDDEQVDF